MMESTEGKWVNRIEEVWIQIDERSKSVGESTRDLSGRLAGTITSLFNRILGQRMISVRVIGISSSFSFASFLSICGLGLEWLVYFIMKYTPASNRSDASFVNVVHGAPILIMAGFAFLFVAGLCLTLAVMPILFRSHIWAWLSCLPTALWLFGTYRLFHYHVAYDKQFGICVALAISIASDLLLLILVRQTLRWLAVHPTITRLIAAITIQGLTLYLIFYIPFLLPTFWQPDMAKRSFGWILIMVSVFNIPTAFASIIFDISLLVILVHRISWPLLSQWTYVLTRKDVLEKRKTVRVIGCALLLFGLSGHSGMLWQIVEKMLK